MRSRVAALTCALIAAVPATSGCASAESPQIEGGGRAEGSVGGTAGSGRSAEHIECPDGVAELPGLTLEQVEASLGEEYVSRGMGLAEIWTLNEV